MIFEVPLDNSGNPVSVFSRSLSGRRIPVHLSDHVIHPCRALSVGGSKLARSLDGFVKELQKADVIDWRNESSESQLISAFEDLCYTGTELFDVYAQGIHAAIELQPNKNLKEASRKYRDVVKKRRSDWALICNKIKHNHNTLVPVYHVERRSGLVVRGFALCHLKGSDSQMINREFHRGSERSRPIELALQQMIHDIFRCDQAASEIVAQLPDHGEETQELKEFTFHIGRQLAPLSFRQVAAAEYQPTMFDGFTLHADRLIFGRHSARLLKGQLEISAVYRGDGYTRSFEMI